MTPPDCWKQCLPTRLAHSPNDPRELNNELEKEGEGLAAHRGFVPTYQSSKWLAENQAFQVYITEAIRRQYDFRLLRQLEQVRACVRGGGGGEGNSAEARGQDTPLKAYDIHVQ